jgi:V/A-type H+-transporting ATPase subunit K
MSSPNFIKKLLAIAITIGMLVVVGASFLVLNAVAQTSAETTPAVKEGTAPASSAVTIQSEAAAAAKAKFGFIAAAVAVGLGSIGAAIAVGNIGTAAMGTIGEKPEMVGSALIFVGLAEGIAIYGLIIAIMILGKL